jgi:hypothetical protein
LVRDSLDGCGLSKIKEAKFQGAAQPRAYQLAANTVAKIPTFSTMTAAK